MTPQTLTAPDITEDQDHERLPSITDHPGGIRAGIDALAEDIRQRYDRHEADAVLQVAAWLDGAGEGAVS
jgi:hypothetical protein